LKEEQIKLKFERRKFFPMMNFLFSESTEQEFFEFSISVSISEKIFFEEEIEPKEYAFVAMQRPSLSSYRKQAYHSSSDFLQPGSI